VIRVARGAEPEALRDERYVRLARAEIAHGEGRPIVFEGYGVARPALYAAQHAKCAYCEMQVQEAELPIEHFRPKDHAMRADGTKDGARYWWLAWTWDNLFFACGTCNGPSHKGNKFPLRDHARALPAGGQPPGAEDPLLIDPARFDPIDFIRFVELTPGRWAPVARTTDHEPYAGQTIEYLGLDAPTLIDFYSNWVQTVVMPAVDRIRAAMENAEDAPRARKTWRDETSRLFARLMPFHALAYDVLASKFPARELAPRGIELERPGTFSPQLPSTDRCNQAHAGLTPELSRRSRALGLRAADADELRALLYDLCQRGPSSAEELAAIIEREPSTVAAYLRHFVAAGTLSLEAGLYRAGPAVP
jgi:uncharacterized protein (TIGR02646 family)